MTVDRRKKKPMKTDDNFTGQFDNVRSESAQVVQSSFTMTLSNE